MKTTQQIFDEAAELANKHSSIGEFKQRGELFRLAVQSLMSERDLEHQLEMQTMYQRALTASDIALREAQQPVQDWEFQPDGSSLITDDV